MEPQSSGTGSGQSRHLKAMDLVMKNIKLHNSGSIF